MLGWKKKYESPKAEHNLMELSVRLPRIPYEMLKEYVEYSKLNPKVKCPGCVHFFQTSDACAQHLFQECIRIKGSDNEDICRSKLTNWVLEYFKFHKLRKRSWLKSDNVPPICDLKVILEDCCSSSKKARLEVKIPEIPFDVECPVCHCYFNTSTACFNHLFRFCLYVENSDNALLVKDWLLEFAWSIDNRKLTEGHDSALPMFDKSLICKYCKLELLDEHYMKKHFRLFHFQQPDSEGSVCFLCNFNALSLEKLVVHFVMKHIKCGCGTKSVTFSLLKEHFRLCEKKSDAVCPLCNEIAINSFETEKDFGNHIRSCPPPIKVKVSVDDLYFNCDVCHQNVLKCSSESHLRVHLKQDDTPRNRQRRVFIQLNDIENVLEVEQLKKFQKLFIK